eukprot:CAMPEP_0175879764 /NCGR_PEP_ID=MMETSP0107_2-20121207/41951_1 /TAXON_ID=195067 ORGANISM="Goniomonas pacifica, Strain CCMP1869" /NCGR_SAMPLE_ID=MMETSP0107_2 /ASSEMBLY_ACC=CAM_ASM_000203 /LENGTH=112 /DNA_ID=CAMNT_0017199449 /DNA_START=12 /DNA_END=350 /DNA_ORIENTATION=+
MAESEVQVSRECANFILDPVQFWWQYDPYARYCVAWCGVTCLTCRCVIRDRVDATTPGWTAMGMDGHPLYRFDDWNGPYGKARSWVMEHNKARYPWAWVDTMRDYVKKEGGL